MQESKPIVQGNIQLEGLRVGQEFAHPWIEKVFEKEKPEGIGVATEAISPEEKRFVALLLDYDLEDNHPRFIFAYYNPLTKRESIVDTKYNIGWTFEYQNKFYKL